MPGATAGRARRKSSPIIKTRAATPIAVRESRGMLDSGRPTQLVLRSMDRVAASESRRRESPAFLHFRRFLAHPVRLASALPVSRAVARMVASKVERQDGEYVVELGSGTGAVTRALLEAGIPASKLIAVEIDSEMATYLAELLPNITVIHGSAAEIDTLLPAEAVDRVGTVICGVPVSLLGEEEQAAMVSAMLALKSHDGQFLAYSYRLCAPLHASALGLQAERLGFTLRNAFPASVWSFRAARREPKSPDK